MREDYIPLEEAKKLIVESLQAFDDDLGTRAASILGDSRRLNIVEVEKAQTNMMQCRPAGVTMDDVIAAGMHIPDFEQRYGPHFTRQDNPENHAIIDFEYDGTPRSIIWLSHEAGHAIADDIQRENGRNYKDYSSAEMEEQAYFVQHIVSKSVRDRFDNLEPESLGEDVLKMGFDRATQFTDAKKTYEAAASVDASRRTSRVHNALDQRAVG